MCEKQAVAIATRSDVRNELNAALNKLVRLDAITATPLIRSVVRSVCGDVEEKVYSRLTFNDKRAKGFRVKLTVSPEANTTGDTLYRVYKSLTAALGKDALFNVKVTRAKAVPSPTYVFNVDYLAVRFTRK